MYLVARQRPLQRRSRTRTNSKPRRRRRHGQGTATQQPRDQEAEKGQDQDQRRSAKPQGCGVAAGDRPEEEVAGGRCFSFSPGGGRWHRRSSAAVLENADASYRLWRRMRGLSPGVLTREIRARRETPHPFRRIAAIPPLPQGERGRSTISLSAPFSAILAGVASAGGASCGSRAQRRPHIRAEEPRHLL